MILLKSILLALNLLYLPPSTGELIELIHDVFKIKVSKSWIYRFIAESDFSLSKGKRISKKRSFIDRDPLSNFCEIFKELVSQYGPSQIFNVDETRVGISENDELKIFNVRFVTQFLIYFLRKKIPEIT